MGEGKRSREGNGEKKRKRKGTEVDSIEKMGEVLKPRWSSGLLPA